MPTGINKDGSPKVRPVNSGRKPNNPELGPKKPGTWSLSADVWQILGEQLNKAQFIENACREKHERDKATKTPARDTAD